MSEIMALRNIRELDICVSNPARSYTFTACYLLHNVRQKSWLLGSLVINDSTHNKVVILLSAWTFDKFYGYTVLQSVFFGS